MAAILPEVRYSVKRSSVNGHHYPARMANRDRTEFGSRVIQARKHAELTQHGLSAATGIKQSTIAEMEVSGQSSLMTPQIARACGVDAYWLATGEGPMVASSEDEPEDEGMQLAKALSTLVGALQAADADKLLAVERWLSAMATDPTNAKNKSDLILKLLVTDADKDYKGPQDRTPEAHIVGQLDVPDLGDNHDGRRNTVTEARRRRK
ncbi:transcriptional regulator with XRE-family HTH domain [Variovorax boronicumulans]|uniref:helix-turn-helix domain-containing protein n=1 Tax=Variovorax boronicumulans TaxID=436515 RepID=UPI00339A828E